MQLTLGLTASLSSLRVFGATRHVFWREAAPGVGMSLHTGAYCTAKCLVEVPRLALLAGTMVAAFYPVALPRTPFLTYLAVNFCSVWAVSSVAYVASIAQDPKQAQLTVVVVVVFSSLFAGVQPRLSKLYSLGHPFSDLSMVSYVALYSLYLHALLLLLLHDSPPDFPLPFSGTRGGRSRRSMSRRPKGCRRRGVCRRPSSTTRATTRRSRRS